MRAALLDATENENSLSVLIRNGLAQRGWEFSSYRLRDMDIRPCLSCGACSFRSPGRCVQKDEMPAVFQALAESYLLVYLTPIHYGGYGFHLKKAIDRSMPLGEPFYQVKKGHLLHPMRYGSKLIVAVGLSVNGEPEEESNFRLLVARNALNMQSGYTVLVYPAAREWARLPDELSGFLEGVL